MSPSTISHHFRNDNDFFSWCGKKGSGYKDKYYIQARKALRYLEKFGNSKMRNKVAKVGYF